MYGSVPQVVIDGEDELLRQLFSINHDLVNDHVITIIIIIIIIVVVVVVVIVVVRDLLNK